MSLPMLVRPMNGHYQALLYGSEHYLAEGPTREAAIVALQAKFDRKPADEVWVTIEWPKAAVSDFAGTWTGEQAEILREITREAYRIRDEEKAAEFPE